MKKMFPLLMSIFLYSFLFAGSDPAECVVDDEEEYTVLAAVLFPNEPEIPEGMTDKLQQDSYRAVRRVRLDGFHGSSYLIRDTSMVSETTRESDPDFVEDFNLKNIQSCKFIKEKMQARLDPGQSVRFSSTAALKENSHNTSLLLPGSDETERGGLFNREIVGLSRPGFDKAKTRAVVDVDLQAGYEMGVGYRVYLEKSSKTGKWMLVGADRTRIY